RDHLGLRASGSHDVVLSDVEIPLDHAVDLRSPEQWASDSTQAARQDQQAWMSVLLSTLYDAQAQSARDWLADFLNTRAPSALGAPLASLPRVQEVFGKITALLHTNRVLLDRASITVDAGA